MQHAKQDISEIASIALEAFALLDLDIVAELFKIGQSKCGNLLYEWNTHQETTAHTIQLPYLMTQLRRIKPKRVLEVGTNCGFFCYFAKRVLPDVKIVTFDSEAAARSSKAVDFLNAHFDSDDITFVKGDSQWAFPSFVDDFSIKTDMPIDFAWIDGSHDYFPVLSDLNSAGELGIPHIYADDYHNIEDVRVATSVFSNSFPYNLVGVTRDFRGIAYLKKEGSDG